MKVLRGFPLGASRVALFSVFEKRGSQDINHEVAREMRNHSRFKPTLPIEISKDDPGNAVEQESGDDHESCNRHEERGRGKMTESEEDRDEDIREPKSRVGKPKCVLSPAPICNPGNQ